MRCLFISRWFPYPPDNGSRLRVLNLIKHLSSRYTVDLISFASEPVSDEAMSAMRRYCERVDVVRYRPFQPTRWTALAGFFSSRPRSVLDTYSVEMQRCVEQAGRERAYDVVIAAQIDVAPYAMALPNVPRVFEEVEVGKFYERYVGERHPLKKLRVALTWYKTSCYVADLLRGFDGCTVVSEREREYVQQIAPGYQPTPGAHDCLQSSRVHVVPNGVDLTCSTDFGTPQADTLVYSGALTYYANWEAIEFFLREAFHLIQAERPGVRLTVTGRLDGVPVDRLPNRDGTVFTGYVDDVRPVVARSWVSIVPLLTGGGTRLKILESLALGTPVVSTNKGAEGLDLVPGRDILIADEPADFADAVLRVLRDANLRETLSRNGRRAVTCYDWQVIGPGFCDFVDEIAVKGKRSA
jgi:glycosyltransferase involved in cell wall biosynthesis